VAKGFANYYGLFFDQGNTIIALRRGHFMRVIWDPSASSGLSRVAGTPELGPLGIDPSRGGPLAHTQASVLVAAEEAPELEVIVTR
jgi:hypothetical protein